MILIFEGYNITKWNYYKCAGQTSKEKAGNAASGITSSMAVASSHKDRIIASRSVDEILFFRFSLTVSYRLHAKEKGNTERV